MLKPINRFAGIWIAGLATIAVLGLVGVREPEARTIILVVTGLYGTFLGAMTVYYYYDSIFDPTRLFRKNSPVTAAFLLYLFLSKSDRETIPGDLDEEFATVILPKFGAPRAWVWYWVQVIRTIAYRNVLCRWLLIGGGIVKVGEWITHKIRS